MSEPEALRPTPHWPTDREVYRFGPFRLDARERTLQRDGQEVALTAKVFDTLLLFLRNPGRLLTREEIAEALWPDAVVQDANLTQNVWMLRKALGDPDGPEKDERFIQTVPKRGYRFVAPVTPVVADDVPPRPEPDPAPRDPAVPAPSSRAGARWRPVVAIGLLLIGAAAGLAVWRGAGPSRPPEPPPPVRRALAIPQFRNLSARAEDEWLSVALAEMLGTELRGPQVRLIPGDLVARASADLAGSALARPLGADLVAIGSYARSGGAAGGHVRLDLRIEDAAGRVRASLAETGADAELFDVVSRLGGKARTALALLPDETDRRALARLALPSDPKAARLYAEGLARLRRGDAPAARDALVEAAAIDPQSAVAHSALASAWLALGYDAKARAEAERAFALSADLPQEQRLELEAVYRESAREWTRAIEIGRALCALYPDEIDHGLRLANVLRLAGKGKDALQTVASLRALPRAADDPRVDMAEAAAAGAVADFKVQQQASARAAEKADRLGLRSLAGRARMSEGNAWAQLGDANKAAALLEAARASCQATGELDCVAAAVQTLGSVAARSGDTARARAFFEEGLRLAEPLGNVNRQSALLNNIASVHKLEGDLRASSAMYERALAMKREIGDRAGEARVLQNLSNVSFDDGAFPLARRQAQDAAAIQRGIGQKRDLAVTLCLLSAIEMDTANLAAARRALDEGEPASRASGAKYPLACGLDHLGAFHGWAGDYAAARKSYEEALVLWRELGDQLNESLSLVGLARVELAAGRPREAAPLLDQAAERLGPARHPIEESAVRLAQADVALAEGRGPAAREALAQVTALLGDKPNRPLQLDRAITVARLAAASGDRGAARETLTRLAREARTMGLLPRELEARLALAEIEAIAGRLAEACRLKSEVRREAQAKGLGQYVQRAVCPASR